MSSATQPTDNARSSDTRPPLEAALDRIAADARRGVTFVSGFPASGKSTASLYLASKVDAIIIDKDVFASSLEESVMAELTGDPYDRDSATYARVIKPHIYQAVIRQSLLIGQRVPVIVDAPFIGHIRSAAQQRIPLATYLTATMSPIAPSVRTIWISAHPNQIRQRMTRRGEPRDAAKLADWNAYCSEVLNSGVEVDARTAVDYVIVND